MKKLLILALFTAIVLIFAASSQGAGGDADWYIPLHSDLRPDIDSAGLGEGTHARNSTAHYWDADNVLQSAVTDVPRFELVGDGTSGSTKWAYLGEPEGVNKCLYNRDLTNAAWTKTRVTISDDATTSPDGTINCDKIVEDSTAADTHYVVQTIAHANFTDNTTTTVSFFAKSAGRDWVQALVRSKAGTLEKVFFDLANGVVGTDVCDSSGIASVGNGFYRCWFTFGVENGANDIYLRIYVAEADDDAIFDGDGSSGVYLWWGQIEDNKKFPSSPIGPTLGSEVTRATESGYPRWDLPSDLFEEDLGVELVTNGTFAADTDWSKQACWSIAAGVATSDGNSGYLAQGVFASVGGKLCKFEIECTVRNSGYFMVRAHDGAYQTIGTISSAGTYVYYYVVPSTSDGNLYITSAGFDGSVDNVSIKQVTNAWDGKPPHGTIVLRWRPGYDYGDQGADNYGIITSRDSEVSLLFHDSVGAGRIRSADGTTYPAMIPAWSSGDWIKLAIQWGYLDSNVSKFRIGYDDDGSGITANWSVWTAFDGAFTVGTHLRLLYNVFGPAHIRDIQGFYRFPTDGEINGLRD